MTKREKYPTKSVLLMGHITLAQAQKILENAPLDAEKPLEFILREQVKTRGLDQNARYWAGPLKDIAEQAYVQGRTYSAEVWAEEFKREFLPEDTAEDLAELVTKPDAYRKWTISPSGNHICTGSTTQLSKKGFAKYLEQIYAYGSNLGVRFHLSPSEVQHVHSHRKD